eukprot:1436901-Prymnesium_polylepis.1
MKADHPADCALERQPRTAAFNPLRPWLRPGRDEAASRGDVKRRRAQHEPTGAASGGARAASRTERRPTAAGWVPRADPTRHRYECHGSRR